MKVTREQQAMLDRMLADGGIYVRLRGVGDGQVTVRANDDHGHFQVIVCVPPPGRRRAWNPARMADAARHAIETMLLHMQAKEDSRGRTS